MRYKRRLGILVAVALAVATGGASPEAARAEFGGALPLWEPEGSPVLLLSGAVMNPPVDTPRAMVIADIDGDGVGELIVGGDYLQVLSLRDGEISQHYLFALVGVKKFVGPGGVQLKVRALAAGDMDGDGRTDLVVATDKGELWVLGNHAQWGFQWRPGSPYKVTGDHVWLFDHDEDGVLDVVLGGGCEVVLLRNHGIGQLHGPEPIAGLEGRLRAGAAGSYAGRRGLFLLTDRGLWFLGPGERVVERVLDRGGSGLAVGNFTGAGKVDVALSQYRNIWVYPGQESGLGEPMVLEAEHPVAWLLAGDFNGDGFSDLVAGSSSPGGFSLFYSWLGKGFLGPYEHGVDVPAMRGLPPMAFAAAVGDLTGDGRDDLAVAASLGHIAFFHAEPRGRSLQAIPGSFLLGSADVNGDGHPDVLTSTAQGGVAVLQNSGWGTFTSRELVGPSGEDRMPYLARIGDVTGDGEAELVVFELSEEQIVFAGPDGTWRRERSKARITAWDPERPDAPLWSLPIGEDIRPLLFLCDLDGDGVMDSVTGLGDKVLGVKDDPAAAVSPWHPRARLVEVPVGGPVGPMALVHYKGRETLAVLRLTEKVELFLVKDGKVLETDASLEVAPLDLVAADLDADGDEDLVAIGWGVQEERLAMVLGVIWVEEGGFRAEVFPLRGWPALAMPFPYGGLVAADLDGDGRLELAAMRLPDREGNPGGVVVIPWTESGPGELVFLPGCVGTGLLALDLDGDGRAELLSVHTGIPARLCITRWEVER